MKYRKDGFFWCWYLLKYKGFPNFIDVLSIFLVKKYLYANLDWYIYVYVCMYIWLYIFIYICILDTLNSYTPLWQRWKHYLRSHLQVSISNATESFVMLSDKSEQILFWLFMPLWYQTRLFKPLSYINLKFLKV